jgi:hypothetical protein
LAQIARNETLVQWGFLEGIRYLIHDRDGKFCPPFDRLLK